MKKVWWAIGGLLLLGAFLFWVRITTPLPSLRIPTIAQLVHRAPSQSAAVANAVPITDGDYWDVTGTIINENENGINIPYIEYSTPDHGIATKQLLFSGTNGCALSPGNYPCVDVNPTTAYPQLPNGTAIRVRGTHYADHILVDQIYVGTGS